MIVDQLKKARIDAMKAKNTAAKDVLGVLLGAIQQKMIDAPDLSDEDIIQMIKKEIKSVRETQQMYIDASRQDEADFEECKISALEVFLPTMLSADQLQTIVMNLGMDLTPQNRGRIIGAVMQDHKTVVDMAVLQQVLGVLLAG